MHMYIYMYIYIYSYTPIVIYIYRYYTHKLSSNCMNKSQINLYRYLCRFICSKRCSMKKVHVRALSP